MSDFRDMYEALKKGDAMKESNADVVQTGTVERKTIEPIIESDYLYLCKAPRTEKEAWRVF